MIFSTFKTFKTFGAEFWFKKSLSAKTFQVLVPKIMKGELNLKDFSTFKSFRTLKRRVCFKEIFYSKHSCKLSLFQFNFSLHFPTLLPRRLWLYLYKKRVSMGQWGVEVANFFPFIGCLTRMLAHALSFFTEIKTKKVQKVVQENSAELKITVPVDTALKNYSAVQHCVSSYF